MIEETFLKASADSLLQLSGRIQDCIGRLTDDQIWTRNAENQNAVGNLVLHLCGNVNQWIGYGVGGRPDHRERDKEFQARGGLSGAQLKERLEKTVSDAVAIIRNVAPPVLLEKRSIQNYEITVLEAIYHVLEHFAQHTGQIIFITKLETGQDLGYYWHLNKPKHSEATP